MHDYQARWRTNTSDVGLTWGQRLDGRPLADAITPSAGQRILEIGPGYGRLLLALADDFASYVGADISPHWVAALGAEFAARRNVSFVCAEAADLDRVLAGLRFDVIASFLTFKHLFPDFARAARAAGRLLAADGRLIFDVPETGVSWPATAGEPSGRTEIETGTYTRHYTRQEVGAILTASGYGQIEFADLYHTPEKRRLLVVAAKP